MQLIQPTTRTEAREQAILWQEWQSFQSLSYAELLEWQAHFTNTAKQFDLIDEFIENGII